MKHINERFQERDSVVFVAMDTIGPLIDHLIGLVGTDRTMNMIQRYRDNLRPDSTGKERTDTGIGALDVQTGLRLADADELNVPVINRWDRPARTPSDHASKGVRFHLKPGLMTGFGVSTDDYYGPDEDTVRTKYWSSGTSEGSRRRTNITVVRTTGWPGEPNREDRIHVEDWNEHGVCQDTLIAFNGR